jgi:hypothetical protein
MSWSWYGVKTMYRWRALGHPKATDAHYDPDAALLEERVVLFRARNASEAIRKGEKEAQAYAASTHINPYGQKVRVHYLGDCLAFILFESPAAGIEVFSDTELIDKTASNKELIERRLGSEREDLRHFRKKFFNREFSGVVKSKA